MRAVIDDLGNAHPGERVIVVSHAASIIAILTDTLRLEPGQLRMLPYYTSVSVVRTLGGRSMVGSIGDVAHLVD
jgi:broad specificity phosphatase PhoE